MSDQAKMQDLLDAYDRPIIPFPDGRKVKAKALPFSRSRHWLAVGVRAEAGEPTAELEIFERFFDEIGIREEVEPLLPLEAMLVFWSFFMVTRFSKNGSRQIAAADLASGTSS